MKQDIRSYLFIAVAFLLGSINILYSIQFYIFLVLAFLVNVKSDFKGFLANVKQEWKYLILPLMGVLYLVVHYLGTFLFGGEINARPSWRTVELLLLYFFFIPLYILSARDFVTLRLLRRFLFSLCWGILLFNAVKLFYITGTGLFSAFGETINLLYSSRFGENMSLLGGSVYLEPQASYLSFSALVGYFFLLENIKHREKISLLIFSSIIMILSLLFLSFTVTKGAILAFVGGFFILSFIYWCQISWRLRLVSLGGIIVLAISVYFIIPQAYVQRMQEMKTEMKEAEQGQFVGGSVGPRAGLMKENFSHFDQFGLWGLGVYKGDICMKWYKNSPYIPLEVTNAHNSFVEFWLRGGILGLLFILYFFFAPVFRMVRKKKYSYFLLALIAAFFIGNNTCILIILVDSNPFVIMMLSMAFLYLDKFIALQDKPILA